ncbi:hypothetical protein BaRGS_00013484 [Batillaria attramentaria]|uniref:Uncharacterized protein n=1 Tax=Batillaria attramentaria TaxID=370345 RepID=A0ABD0L755_9CAEN
MSGNIRFELYDLDTPGHLATTDTVAMVRTSPPMPNSAKGGEANRTKEEDGVKRLLALYGNSASIHGMSQIGGPALYGYRRWLWVLLVLSMSIGLSVILYKQVRRLSNYPTRTTVRPEFQEEIEFPAVTICNLNQFYRDRLPDDPGLHHLIRISSEWTYLTKDDPHITTTTTTTTQSSAAPRTRTGSEAKSPSYPKSNITGTELYDIVWHAAHPKSSFLYKCTWQSRLVPCEDIFEARMTDLGVCFTFNGNLSRKILTCPMTGPWMGLRVVLFLQQEQYYFAKTMQAGVKVVLHEPGREPMPDTAGLLVRPGVSAFMAFSKQIAPDFNRTLYRYRSYSQMACARDCLLAIAEDNQAARSISRLSFVSVTRRNLSFCSVDQMVSCYIPASDNFTFADLHACDCRPACERVSYNVKTSYADFASDFMEQQIPSDVGDGKAEFLSRNLVDVRVFLDTMTVLHVQQEPEMTLPDVLGALGGHLGLFLGASILSVTELTEMLVLLVLECIRRGTERKSQETVSGEGSPSTHCHLNQGSEQLGQQRL